MRYFIPFYGFWCLAHDACKIWNCDKIEDVPIWVEAIAVVIQILYLVGITYPLWYPAWSKLL